MESVSPGPPAQPSGSASKASSVNAAPQSDMLISAPFDPQCTLSSVSYRRVARARPSLSLRRDYTRYPS